MATDKIRSTGPEIKRNQQNKTPLEERICALKSPSQGFGDRPHPALAGPPPSVGPGSYNIVFSAKGQRSALDGPEFASTTLKIKLPSSLVPYNLPSPGPHARYEVRKDLDSRFPQYSKDKPLLSHGGRPHDPYGANDPGPGHYHSDTYKSVSISASCPNLRGGGEHCMEATGGTKRCLKGTFGTANRFEKAKVPNSSPQGDRYYAHSKIWGQEEYLSGVRSCSFGVCGKTDMANPLRGPRHDVGPGHYEIDALKRGYSCAMRTSPLDGITTRSISPVNQFAKNLGSTKSAHRKSPMGFAGSPSSTQKSAGHSGGGAIAAGGGDA